MQSKDYQQLRKCPFCGKSDKVTIYTESMAQYGKLLWIRYGVKCKRCHFGIPIYAKKAAAIKKWNNRPIEDEKDKEIESLKVELNNLRNFCDSILEMAKRNNGVLYFKQDSGTWKIETGEDNDVPANDTEEEKENERIKKF